jgi:EAL domain-containing protein (putative c-di-GMP-specific phosphodiesterase class I)
MKEHSALDSLLAPGGIRPLYQPLYALTHGDPQLFAFECLSRGAQGTNFEKAPVLFEYVRLKRQEALVDRICIATALEQLPPMPPGTKVCVNVHASTLARDPGFIDFLARAIQKADLHPARVIVDVIQHAPSHDGDGFALAVKRLRTLGVAIALDDVGVGASNFKMLLDVSPDYLKLDRCIVDGCSEDSKRCAVIESLVELATRLHSTVVAEGIETDDDLVIVQSLGVRIVQGFLLALPMEGRKLAEWPSLSPSSAA